jgi:hypothetical protein
VPSFLLDAFNLRVDCNWTSDERMMVDAGTTAATLMQYSPLVKQTFKALTLESTGTQKELPTSLSLSLSVCCYLSLPAILCCTEEDRAFWLTYDKKPSGSRVAQSIGVGLGKATAFVVPEGISRLFDTVPVIWGALGRYGRHSHIMIAVAHSDVWDGSDAHTCATQGDGQDWPRTTRGGIHVHLFDCRTVITRALPLC